MEPDHSFSTGQAVGSCPTGTVTFVLGDVAGSSAAWERDPEIAEQTIATLDGVVRKLVDAHGGACPVEQGEGDSFVAAFARTASAVGFALDFQHALLTSAWPGETPLVRVGVHTGDVQFHDGCYRGDVLNRCARIRSLAHGGQVLVSAATAELVVDHLPDDAFLRDVGVHRLRDLQRPESLRQLCHPDLPFDFPPLRSLDRLPHNLPLQLTSFVGRDRELEEVAAIVHRSRCVTLTGAGGAGKTRLALHAAANELDRHDDGVWFVDLAPLRDPDLVARAVAQVLHVHEMPFEDVGGAIVRYLEARSLLLVIDNCEHLVDSCAALVTQIVMACPAVSVLATSREPLGVDGEQVVRVPSLALPDGDGQECAAVELFVDRARAARNDIVFTGGALAAVTRICRRLDGLPLAIELAAARCRSLSPEQIAGRLEERFALVSGGARGALARQRTLEASVQWSLDLLSSDERSLMLRLSVFTGGFSLDAAAAVAELDPDAQWRAIDLVSSLVDRSLVVVDPSSPLARYRLLETVRHVAGEQLLAGGEVEHARQLHAAFYLGLATAIGADLAGPRSNEAIQALDIELDNVRAALTWLIAMGSVADALALAVPLHLHWCRHASRETLALLDSVLASRDGDAALRARLLVTAAEVAWVIGDLDRNAEYVAAVETYAGEADDPELSRLASLYRGYRELLVGDGAAASALLECASAFREAGQYFWSSDAWMGLGLDAWWRGDLRRADAFLHDAVADARVSGHPIALARALVNRAGVVRELGDLMRSAELLDDADEIAESSSDVVVGPVALGLRALLHAATGHFEAALTQSLEGVEAARRSGSVTIMGQPAWANALARYWSNDTTADSSLHEAMAFSDLIGHAWGRAACRVAAADLARAGGDLAAADRLVHEALDVCAMGGHATLVHSAALLALARVEHAQGIVADDTVRQALRVALEQGLRERAIEGLQLMATCAADGERFDVAARLHGAAAAARDAIQLVIAPVFASEAAALEARLRTALGEPQFAALCDEGKTLDLVAAQQYEARGRGQRRRPKSGWSSLTSTELAVAELVATGSTNAAVAERLFISVTTVKTHVSHIYAKLGVTNRAELAASAAAPRAARNLPPAGGSNDE